MTNEFLYGSIGGFIGTILSHPMDTVKTRIQSGYADTIISAIKSGKLYSGLAPPLVGIMLEKSIVFGFYNRAKEYGFNNFWSGIVGGFVSTITVTPIDRLKIHFQNNNKEKLNYRTLYRGFAPTIFRETPGFGIYFTTYSYLNHHNDSLIKSFIYGGMSGFSAWLFIYPADLIKTKYQSQSTSLSTIIQTIYQNNGKNKSIFNFYSGFSLAIMRAIPLHGGVFLGYEMSKKYIEQTDK